MLEGKHLRKLFAILLPILPPWTYLDQHGLMVLKSTLGYNSDNFIFLLRSDFSVWDIRSSQWAPTQPLLWGRAVVLSCFLVLQNHVVNFLPQSQEKPFLQGTLDPSIRKQYWKPRSDTQPALCSWSVCLKPHPVGRKEIHVCVLAHIHTPVHVS